MATALAIAEKYLAAFSAGDTKAINDLIGDSIVFDGPMMKIEGREPFMQAMTGLAKAWKSDHKHIRAIGNGEDAALLYDFVMTEPIKQTVRMTEWYRVRNGKIDEIRLLFDTAKFTPPDGM